MLTVTLSDGVNPPVAVPLAAPRVVAWTGTVGDYVVNALQVNSNAPATKTAVLPVTLDVKRVGTASGPLSVTATDDGLSGPVASLLNLVTSIAASKFDAKAGTLLRGQASLGDTTTGVVQIMASGVQPQGYRKGTPGDQAPRGATFFLQQVLWLDLKDGEAFDGSATATAAG